MGGLPSRSLVLRFARRSLAAAASLVFTHPPVAHASPPKIREASVAGIFYPADARELSAQIDRFLASARSGERLGTLRAIVCPHAGYAYSGPVAAAGYGQAAGRDFATVVILAPSHTALLDAASVSGAAAFRTPLGDVPIAPMAARLAKLEPFELEPRCQSVRRPPWAEVSPRAAEPASDDRADTWEHADEVQVPFIQKVLPKASIVPVVMGDVDPARAARALSKVLDDATLIVASSDLSHYHAYSDAKARDRRTVDAICRLDGDALGADDACGYIPIRTLIDIAKARGWKARLLDLRNSGDTAGDKSRVVGYASIAFYEPASSPGPKEPASAFSSEEKQILLALARRALIEAVENHRTLEADPAVFPESLRAPRGCFVTLTEAGDLRGCIGNILPQHPLVRAVAQNALSAALRDPRFRPVAKAELRDIQIEVSVLTVPEPLAFTSPSDLLARLRPGIDGVVLEIGRRSATYLPQVWEQLPTPERFLDSLAEKAGCDASDWRGGDVKVLTYQAEHFKESDSSSSGSSR